MSEHHKEQETAPAPAPTSDPATIISERQKAFEARGISVGGIINERANEWGKNRDDLCREIAAGISLETLGLAEGTIIGCTHADPNEPFQHGISGEAPSISSPSFVRS